jgi:hypothetical protein
VVMQSPTPAMSLVKFTVRRANGTDFAGRRGVSSEKVVLR